MRQNKVRFIITSAIISVGLMALVGILTAIDGIKSGLTKQFSTLGANSFNIKNSAGDMQFKRRGKRQVNFPRIDLYTARKFKEKFSFPATVSIAFNATWNATLRYRSRKSDPNVLVMGTDENYVATGGYILEEGRNFLPVELLGNTPVAIIGHEIKKRFFKGAKAAGNYIFISEKKYRIIGVLDEKGSSMGFGADRIVLLPVNMAQTNFSSKTPNFVISVGLTDAVLLESAIPEARQLMRNLRRLHVSDEDNFNVLRSDGITQKLFENLYMVTAFAAFIAFITLLGAAIGLMNIMLVSVTERTREIGTRKALGATAANIRGQFLTESVMICIMGGSSGIVLGIFAGNLVGSLLAGTFFIPWNWLLLGLSVCIITGVLAGFYPANKAARLSPIEALRYE